MIHNAPLQQDVPRPDLSGAILKRLAQILFGLVMVGALMFVSAGRIDWWWAWAYLAVVAITMATISAILIPRNPEVIAERASPGKNIKGWDRVLTPTLSTFTIGVFLLAGLDFRFGWTASMALWLHLLGMVLYIAGYLLIMWAMASNKFFSTVVRIQQDRGHTVSTGGPYHYVRHPGYSGMILSILAAPLVLGSWWALIPASVCVILYVTRTILEDRTLQEELAGYREYAQQTRYRLIPGIW